MIVFAQPVELAGIVEARSEFAIESSDRAAEVIAASRTFTLPKRHNGRRAFRRADENAIGLDSLQAPGVGPEHKRIADTPLENELFIQLADTNAGSGVRRVLPRVGDRAAVHQRQRLTPR